MNVQDIVVLHEMLMGDDTTLELQVSMVSLESQQNHDLYSWRASLSKDGTQVDQAILVSSINEVGSMEEFLDKHRLDKLAVQEARECMVVLAKSQVAHKKTVNGRVFLCEVQLSNGSVVLLRLDKIFPVGNERLPRIVQHASVVDVDIPDWGTAPSTQSQQPSIYSWSKHHIVERIDRRKLHDASAALFIEAGFLD